MFGNKKIKKNIKIEGMSCMHCAKKVENGLKEIKEVKSVNVNLEEKNAEVILKQEVEKNYHVRAMIVEADLKRKQSIDYKDKYIEELEETVDQQEKTIEKLKNKINNQN